MKMRNKLITVFAVAITAGGASAQVARPDGDGTNVVRSNRAATELASLSGNSMNILQPLPAVHQFDSFGLDRVLNEPLSMGPGPWPPDRMAATGGEDWSFLVPEDIQFGRDVLYRKLDLLVQADTRSSPVHFGVDSEVKFVEHHDYQPGIPLPVGMSYRNGQQRLVFFGELAPILDPALTTSMGWGGGIGIRIYLGRQ
jgi:hypothetical protein